MEEQKKSPFKSKTLWVNFIIAAIAFFPGVSTMIDADQLMMGMAVVNMVLRLVTKDRIVLG